MVVNLFAFLATLTWRIAGLYNGRILGRPRRLVEATSGQIAPPGDHPLRSACPRGGRHRIRFTLLVLEALPTALAVFTYKGRIGSQPQLS